MKTTRRQAAIKALERYGASVVPATVDLLIHVMKAEHARHARVNVCTRKPRK